jgi:hypothetical protein
MKRISITIIVGLLIVLTMACSLLNPPSGNTPQNENVPNTDIPATLTPRPPLSVTQTYVATTSPVHGSIEVAPGISVIGGAAGSTRQVPVKFSATSAFGKVTEMRMDDGEWEAMVPEKEYTITIALNWSSIYHCVEFRDEKGNISPRYCDNKGVEGSPPSVP